MGLIVSCSCERIRATILLGLAHASNRYGSSSDRNLLNMSLQSIFPVQMYPLSRSKVARTIIRYDLSLFLRLFLQNIVTCDTMVNEKFVVLVVVKTREGETLPSFSENPTFRCNYRR